MHYPCGKRCMCEGSCAIFSDTFDNDGGGVPTGWTVESGTWDEDWVLQGQGTGAVITCDTTHPVGDVDASASFTDYSEYGDPPPTPPTETPPFRLYIAWASDSDNLGIEFDPSGGDSGDGVGVSGSLIKDGVALETVNIDTTAAADDEWFLHCSYDGEYLRGSVGGVPLTAKGPYTKTGTKVGLGTSTAASSVVYCFDAEATNHPNVFPRKCNCGTAVSSNCNSWWTDPECSSTLKVTIGGSSPGGSCTTPWPALGTYTLNWTPTAYCYAARGSWQYEVTTDKWLVVELEPESLSNCIYNCERDTKGWRLSVHYLEKPTYAPVDCLDSTVSGAGERFMMFGYLYYYDTFGNVPPDCSLWTNEMVPTFEADDANCTWSNLTCKVYA